MLPLLLVSQYGPNQWGPLAHLYGQHVQCTFTCIDWYSSDNALINCCLFVSIFKGNNGVIIMVNIYIHVHLWTDNASITSCFSVWSKPVWSGCIRNYRPHSWTSCTVCQGNTQCKTDASISRWSEVSYSVRVVRIVCNIWHTVELTRILTSYNNKILNNNCIWHNKY